MYALIVKHPGQTTLQWAWQLSLSEDTIRRNIKPLVNAGQVEHLIQRRRRQAWYTPEAKRQALVKKEPAPLFFYRRVKKDRNKSRAKKKMQSCLTTERERAVFEKRINAWIGKYLPIAPREQLEAIENTLFQYQPKTRYGDADD